MVVNLPYKPLVALGLDYESLKQLRPDIILTTVSAFSYSGENRNQVGFDGMGQALSGAMHLTGTGESPMRSAVSYVDYATGMSAAFMTASALLERNVRGTGKHVQCSLMGTALTMMNPMLMEEATSTRRRIATANRSPIAGPSDLFAASDGWIMVQVIGDAMFKGWAGLVGHQELVEDSRFASDIRRGENGEILSTIMRQWCAARTVAECLALMTQARIPACPVLTPADALRHQGTGEYMHYVSTDAKNDPLPIVTGMPRVEPSGPAGMMCAPKLGEHTEQVLQDIGMDRGEIEGLRKEGTI